MYSNLFAMKCVTLAFNTNRKNMLRGLICLLADDEKVVYSLSG